MADWANLPTEIVTFIAQRLVFMEDFLSLCFVCKSWQLVTSILGKMPPLAPRFPWVLLPDGSMRVRKPYPLFHWHRLLEAPPKEAEDSIKSIRICRFYSLSTLKTYEFELPEVTHRKCVGASYGWILTVGYDLQINILHPFSRQQISLPPLSSFKDLYQPNEYKHEEGVTSYVPKVVMSKNPQDEDCIVVAIYGQYNELAFAKPGDDQAWHNIDVPSKVYQDVIYYKGKFYGVDYHGALCICDLDDENGPRARTIAPTPLETRNWHHYYLVESLGDLLLVFRLRKEMELEGSCFPRQYTAGFRVFRLEKCSGDVGVQYPYKWVEIQSLCDMALFLGNNVSFSLSSSKCVKANCIYFSEDDHIAYIYDPNGGGYDTGIYDVENGVIESHYAATFGCPLSPPFWYV